MFQVLSYPAIRRTEGAECDSCGKRIEEECGLIDTEGLDRIYCSQECYSLRLPTGLSFPDLCAEIRRRLPDGIMLNVPIENERVALEAVDTRVPDGVEMPWSLRQFVRLDNPTRLWETASFVVRQARGYVFRQSHVRPATPLWLLAAPRHPNLPEQALRMPLLLKKNGEPRQRVVWLGFCRDDTTIGAFALPTEFHHSDGIHFAPLSRFAEYLSRPVPEETTP